MNTKYEKELNRICLHIHVPEIYEEDYQMPMLRANKIPGILEVNGCRNRWREPVYIMKSQD